MDNLSLDLFGKLLAEENISISRSKQSTASFNINTRVLTLPVWNELDDFVETMLVEHEVGHALYTSTKFINFATDPTRPGIHDYLNVCEDARIERLIKEKFPGCIKDFYKGYDLLHSRDFFGLEGKDYSKYSLIDRINLYFKLGTRVDLVFAPDEIQYVDRLSIVILEEDVRDIAVELYDLQLKKSKEKQQESIRTLESSKNLSGEGSAKMTDRVLDEVLDEVLDRVLDEVLGSETQKSFEKNLSKQVKEIRGDVFNLKLENHFPIKIIKLEEVLKDFKIIDRSIEPVIINHYADFKLTTSKIVSMMVQEFELRKAAKLSIQNKTADSGKLDISKIYKYKIADDIFRQFKIDVHSKNHGFIMLLDFSGSMSDKFSSVVGQVITLVQFCSAVDIKYEVLAFTDSPSAYSEKTFLDEYEHRQNILMEKSRKLSITDLICTHNSGVTLIQLYRTGMRSTEIEFISSMLYNRRCHSTMGRSIIGLKDFEVQNLKSLLLKYKLSSTPLIEALIFINRYISEFKLTYGVDKTSLIILTDGQAAGNKYISNTSLTFYDPRYGSSIFVKSARSIKSFKIFFDGYGNSDNIALQNTLISVIKHDNPTTKIIGVFVVFREVTRTRFKRDLVAYKDYCSNTNFDDCFKDLQSSGISELPVIGYDKFFLAMVGNTSSELELDSVNTTMTSSQIYRSLSSGLATMNAGRILAKSFIREIA